MKDQKHILSVIVPIYNVEPYLSKCINSILDQTYKNLEVILVDDGSTDNCLEICRNYVKSDSRVKVIHKNNGGLVSARKAGLNVSSGKYVTYVDSDDWIENNMYEKMMHIVNMEEPDVVTSGYIRDYGTYHVEEQSTIPDGIYMDEYLRKKVLSKIIDIDYFYQTGIDICLWNKIFKSDLLKKYQSIVDNDIAVGEDIACVVPCLLNAKKIAVTRNCYYHYCIRDDSIMGNHVKWKSYELLFNHLHREMNKYKNEIPNIMIQFQFIKYYYTLLKYPEKVLCMKEKVFFPFGELNKEDRLVVYGAGRFGTQVMNYLTENFGKQIVAWVDKKNEMDLKNDGFDKIIVAVLKENIVEQICRELQEKGIEEGKILRVSLKLLIE